SYSLRAVRPLAQLRGGALVGAFGLERQKTSLDDRSDPLSVGSLLAAATIGKRWVGMRVDQPLDQIDPYAYIDPWDASLFPLEPTGSALAQGGQSLGALMAEL